MNNGFPLISELTWKTARHLVADADPVLCSLIDEINPSEAFKLYKIHYRYGDTIYAHGAFYVPDTQGASIPIMASNAPDFVKEGLSYQSMPLGFIVKKSIEIHRVFGKKISPVAHRSHGLELGIWEMFAPIVPNIVTAGARSIFLLPKISDKVHHSRLRVCGVRSQPASHYFDQWRIFQEIANYREANQNEGGSEAWECEILFFDGLWKKHIFSDDRWKNMRLFLTEKGLNHTQSALFTETFEVSMNNFFEIIRRKSLKYSPRTIDIFKHLLLILNGSAPAFKPVENNENIAPVSKIYETYINVYGLKNYYPTMVYADYFNADRGGAVYYSLKAFSHLETSGNGRKRDTFKKELIELVDFVEHFSEELSAGNLGAESQYLANLMKKTVFNYFHQSNDNDYGVLHPSKLAEMDKRLIFSPLGNNDSVFSDRNPFVNGCIKISHAAKAINGSENENE